VPILQGSKICRVMTGAIKYGRDPTVSFGISPYLQDCRLPTIRVRSLHVGLQTLS